MQCPTDSFLESFVNDPDTALMDLPLFEQHLAECEECRNSLERIAKTSPATSLAEVMFQPSLIETQIPQIEGYELIEAVGTGGFGVVYRGIHLASNRLVAIKVIQSLAPAHWKRIVLEREALVKCDHPNIITLLDYGQQTGGCYFVYRWMEESLSHHIAQTNLVDLETAIDWIIEITDAVAHIHSLGIVHRDLKPSNILLSATGKPKITDFGIAKDLTKANSDTTVSRPIGTPGFMAPEQTGRVKVCVSSSTDIYGLGALLYSIITGRPPFVGAETEQLLEQVVGGTPIAPRKLRPEIPKDLEVICLKCLQKCQGDRYADAQELLDDLKRFANGEPIHARPLPTLTKILRWSLRQPIVSAMAITMVAIICFASLSFVMFRTNASRQKLEMQSQSLLNTVRNASPDHLVEIYAQADMADRAALTNAVEIAWREHRLEPIVKLRWASLVPDLETIVIAPEELVTVIVDLNPEEIAVIVRRLIYRRDFCSMVLIAKLREIVMKSGGDIERIRAASVLGALDHDWDQWPIVSGRIVRALAACSSTEAKHWANALKPIQKWLLSEALKPPPIVDGRGLQFDIPNEYFNSENVRAVLWHWISSDDELVLRYVEVAPKESLAMLSSLKPELRQKSLSRIKSRWKRELDSKIRLASRTTVSPELDSLLKRCVGEVFQSRGYVLATKQSELSQLVDALLKNGYCLTSFQPYEKDGTTYFAASFEASTDACEVDWAVELGSVEDRMRECRERGLEAVAFWVKPESEPKQVSILWRQGAWEPSQFRVGESSIKREEIAISTLDGESLETEFRIQQLRIGESQFDYGLLTQRKIQKRDESNGRVANIFGRSIGNKVHVSTSRQIEYLADGGSCLSFPACSFDSHATQGNAVFSAGYEPIEVCVDGNSLQVTSQWRKTADTARARDFSSSIQASLAIASWILGDPQMILAAIERDRDPTLRVLAIEWIGQVDREPRHFLNALKLSLSPSQYQGVLLAMENLNRNRLAELGVELQQLLERLWLHDDSGVHFAADHLRRMAFPSECNQVVDPSLCEGFGLSAMKTGRNWYYGPFGLPFVVVPGDNLHLVGSDERIPWLVNVDRQLVSLKRTYSVCAVETPEWLMRKFLEETGRLELDRYQPGHRRIEGPAAGYSLRSILMFCRWMSDRENLDPQRIGLPSIKEIQDGIQLPDDFLSMDGYRLPTNVEWEIACRAGTWTSSFLGESYQFLDQNSWNSSNSVSHSHPIATKKPNPWGFFDILGNVHEAVMRESLGSSFTAEPSHWRDWTLGPKTTMNIRGGSFLSSKIYCASGSHHVIESNSKDINAGFRIVRTLYLP